MTGAARQGAELLGTFEHLERLAQRLACSGEISVFPGRSGAERVLQGLVAAAFLAAASVSAAAIEPIKISRGDVALDLSGAVQIYRNQGENFQVSTAPGPDGIVRRIEVEANDARSTGDWARVRARQPDRRAARPADRRAAFPPGRFRAWSGPISARPASPRSRRAKASRSTARRAPTPTSSG